MEMARILVVEDEQITALDLTHSLERAGYGVVGTCSSGTEAISKAEKLRPDLILMDISLDNGVDGITAASTIQKELQIPIVYLTAHADDQTIARAKATSPHGYLLKPFHEIELQTTIQMALSHAALGARSKEKAIFGNVDTMHRVSNFQELLQILKGIELFRGIEASDLEYLANKSTLEEFAAGSILTGTDSPEVRPFVVTQGRVALVRNPLADKQLIVEVLNPGDTLGLIFVLELDDEPSTPKALTQTEVLWIPPQELLQILDHYPSISRKLSTSIAAGLRQSYSNSSNLIHETAANRIAKSLYKLSPDGISPNREFFITITRKELADMAGVTVETAVRTLKDFERKKIVRLGQRGRITICSTTKLEESLRS